MKSVQSDIVVVGGGVAGLMLSHKLSGLGLETILLEKNNNLAQGPSTRNEGWLHNGTYHANSVRNREGAIQVARRCRYGHQQIRRFAPEAVEDPDLPSIALLRDNNRYEELVSRWNEAGVPYKELSLKELARIVPEVKKEYVAKAFEVGDVGINTRILYSKLLHLAKKQGTKIITGTQAKIQDAKRLTVQTNKEELDINTKLLVLTAGYNNKNLMKDNFGVDIPLRYWKSHLVNTPRISKIGTFLLDPNEVGMMHHDSISIVGFNEDAVVLDEPNFDVIPEKVESLIQQLTKAYHLDENTKYAPVACLKVDVPKELNVDRSLNISVIEPVEDVVCAFPGKMTETPYLTDFLVKFLYNKLSREQVTIAFRPSDIMRNKLLCKQGVCFEEDTVYKKQASIEQGRLEEEVAKIFSSNTEKVIRVPEYHGTIIRDGRPHTAYKHIEGNNLFGNTNQETIEELVEDLALFHEIFSQDPKKNSSSVLYRDAIKGNYLETNEGIYHIDFSSSSQFVHCFDDLALLLNPSWGEIPKEKREELVDKYILQRKEFRNKGVNRLDNLSNTSKSLITNKVVEERREHYRNKVLRMAQEGFVDETLHQDISRANYERINRDDFQLFERFRKLRADFYIHNVWKEKKKISGEKI